MCKTSLSSGPAGEWDIYPCQTNSWNCACQYWRSHATVDSWQTYIHCKYNSLTKDCLLGSNVDSLLSSDHFTLKVMHPWQFTKKTVPLTIFSHWCSLVFLFSETQGTYSRWGKKAENYPSITGFLCSSWQWSDDRVSGWFKQVCTHNVHGLSTAKICSHILIRHQEGGGGGGGKG